jgi:plastocyanin
LGCKILREGKDNETENLGNGLRRGDVGFCPARRLRQERRGAARGYFYAGPGGGSGSYADRSGDGRHGRRRGEIRRGCAEGREDRHEPGPELPGIEYRRECGRGGWHLENVFVYVKDGLGTRTFDLPTEVVTLNQSGCRYHPHVLGVMAGQTIKIVNSDPTTHNIHPTPKDNREWNESQAPQAAPLEKNFAREEIMLPVKCNQHPWMRMFVNVVKNPFYAVTGPDGKYELKGLPPGDYTIAFVHEKFPEQDQKVTLAAKDSKTVDVTFKP